MNEFYLCSEGKCCPKVVVEEEVVIITDEEGGQVKLTKEEIRILSEKLK